jgi:dihydrofolate reductase
MRKLKLQMQISLDGFVAGPNGEEDWVVRGSDPELWQLINELADTSDTLLLGRKMAEAFIPHFEGFSEGHPRYEFAQKMNNLEKYIFSKTLQAPFGPNTFLASGELNDHITELKKRKGKDILVYGGASFVSSLLAGGHVDELYLFLNPVLINQGLGIFRGISEKHQLELISARSYLGGINVLHYKWK